MPLLTDGKLVTAHSQFDSAKPDPKKLETAIHIALGLTYGSDGRVPGHSTHAKAQSDALDEFKQALALEPDSPLANLYYAHGLRKQDRLAESDAAYKKAIAMSDGDIKAQAQSEMNYRPTPLITPPLH